MRRSVGLLVGKKTRVQVSWPVRRVPCAAPRRQGLELRLETWALVVSWPCSELLRLFFFSCRSRKRMRRMEPGPASRRRRCWATRRR